MNEQKAEEKTADDVVDRDCLGVCTVCGSLCVPMGVIKFSSCLPWEVLCWECRGRMVRPVEA